jgi:hypothetical protein
MQGAAAARREAPDPLRGRGVFSTGRHPARPPAPTANLLGGSATDPECTCRAAPYVAPGCARVRGPAAWRRSFVCCIPAAHADGGRACSASRQCCRRSTSAGGVAGADRADAKAGRLSRRRSLPALCAAAAPLKCRLADVRLRSLHGVVTEVSRLESLVALLEVISLAAAASAGPFHRTRIPRAVAAHVRRFALRPAWCTVACPSNGPLEEATMVASLYLASDVPGGALATLTPFAKRAFRPRGSGAGPLERATAIFPPVLSTAPNSRHGRNITVRLLPLRRCTASARTDGSLAAHSRPNALRLALGR